jgi:hypothetical protein
MRTTTSAISLPTSSVRNAIQSKYKTECVLMLIRGQCNYTAKSVLKFRSCPKHLTRRKRRLQLAKGYRDINLFASGIGLMTHERDSPQPNCLLGFRQRLEPTNRVCEQQTTLGNSIEQLRVGRQ